MSPKTIHRRWNHSICIDSWNAIIFPTACTFQLELGTCLKRNENFCWYCCYFSGILWLAEGICRRALRFEGGREGSVRPFVRRIYRLLLLWSLPCVSGKEPMKVAEPTQKMASLVFCTPRVALSSKMWLSRACNYWEAKPIVGCFRTPCDLDCYHHDPIYYYWLSIE